MYKRFSTPKFAHSYDTLKEFDTQGIRPLSLCPVCHTFQYPPALDIWAFRVVIRGISPRECLAPGSISKQAEASLGLSPDETDDKQIS
jgi:hypothetical protein